MSRPEKIVRECAKCGVKFMAEKEGRDYQKFCCNCQENRRGRNEKRKMPEMRFKKIIYEPSKKCRVCGHEWAVRARKRVAKKGKVRF